MSEENAAIAVAQNLSIVFFEQEPKLVNQVREFLAFVASSARTPSFPPLFFAALAALYLPIIFDQCDKQKDEKKKPSQVLQNCPSPCLNCKKCLFFCQE